MNELNKILENEDLLAGLVEAETPGELATLFTAHNIVLADDLTIEEAFNLVKAQENAELTDTDLDSVSGGVASAVLLGAACTMVLAASVVIFISGYAYQSYKNNQKKKKKKK